MMEQNDKATLREMQQKIGACTNESLGETADQLLWLRDRLRFNDDAWYDDFTQHVATLDSGSTFIPANDAEKDQFIAAVEQASKQIESLIASKLT